MDGIDYLGRDEAPVRPGEQPDGVLPWAALVLGVVLVLTFCGFLALDHVGLMSRETAAYAVSAPL